MHQAFTGSARKSRQVNLSGRSNQNPWAALPGSAKSSHGVPGSHATVAQAQAERQRRQQERDRLNASRKIQRMWRGHDSRRRQKAQWRQEWDAREQHRIQPSTSDSFLTSQNQPTPYDSLDSAVSQLRLLSSFQEFRRRRVRDKLDTMRLLYFADALEETLRQSSPSLSPEWQLSLARLGVIAARHMRSSVLQPDNNTVKEIYRLAFLLSFLASTVPKRMGTDASLYMQVLKEVIDSQPSAEDVAVNTISSLLLISSEADPSFHDAFASEVLSDDVLSHHLSAIKSMAMSIDLTLLAKALPRQVNPSRNLTLDPTARSKLALWQLSYLIRMYRYTPRQNRQGLDNDFTLAVSALLAPCANEVADRWDAEDFSMSETQPTAQEPLPTFVHENLVMLVQQDTVRQSISSLSTQSEKASDFEVARRFADYAVSMLRAFPSKASNIRLWLYQASVTSITGKDVSTIPYFWSTASRTGVYSRISRDSKSVLSVLKEAAPESHQIRRPALTLQAIDLWREEWRIILLFLELYTFVLKLMDDDDFFSLDMSKAFKSDDSASSLSQFRKGALPLSDIASMTTFLKNLAFTLYWNVADLVDSDESEATGDIAALFGNFSNRQPVGVEAKHQSLTGNGVSYSYLKGLTTGLLRMVHERDSRRQFLPRNHWLMTSQIEMAGFIPAVVAEEEKRHEIGDEDEEDTDLDQDMAKSELANANDSFAPSSTLMQSVFNIRQPHLPRSVIAYHGRLERQQKNARRKRLIESLAPRLEILRNLPFFFPFEVRVQIFREFVYRDQLRRRDGFVDADQWRMNLAHTSMLTQGRDINDRPRNYDRISRQHAEIHRESVFEDAFTSFYALADGLKEPIQISFIDRFGATEAGIDGGGVTKEFLMSVTTEALDPNQPLSMFAENEQRYLYPNPLIFDEFSEDLKRVGVKKGTEDYQYQIRDFLRRFEFLGRVIGKCLYEGILIDVNFAGFFLLKWALTGGTTSASSETAYRASINDLRDYDEALYQGLLKLKNYAGDVESDFSLNFTVTDTITLSKPTSSNPHHTSTTTISRDLIPSGSTTPVTNLNRHLYIDRIVRYRLQQQPHLVTNAFLRGLGQIIQPMWLAMFNQKELQHLIGGDNSDLDIADLRRNTQYSGLYILGDDGIEHPTVQMFWRVLQSMSDTDRRKVIKFVTSTPRAPLLGFGHLNPKFSIRDSSDDQTRLPSTSTCVNLLKLPIYKDEEGLRTKLLYAVNAGAGFDLS